MLHHSSQVTPDSCSDDSSRPPLNMMYNLESDRFGRHVSYVLSDTQGVGSASNPLPFHYTHAPMHNYTYAHLNPSMPAHNIRQATMNMSEIQPMLVRKTQSYNRKGNLKKQNKTQKILESYKPIAASHRNQYKKQNPKPSMKTEYDCAPYNEHTGANMPTLSKDSGNPKLIVPSIESQQVNMPVVHAQLSADNVGTTAGLPRTPIQGQYIPHDDRELMPQSQQSGWNDRVWGYDRANSSNTFVQETFDSDKKKIRSGECLSPPLVCNGIKHNTGQGNGIRHPKNETEVLLTPDSRASSPAKFVRTKRLNTTHCLPPEKDDVENPSDIGDFVDVIDEVDTSDIAEFDFREYGLTPTQACSFKEILERQLEALYKSVSDDFNCTITKKANRKIGIEFVLAYMHEMFDTSEFDEKQTMPLQ